MESFLLASKAALANLRSYRKVRLVMGNQTCDLDSAVCTLAEGFAEYTEAKKLDKTDVAIIPLMNIPEKEFRVKTEVIYYFQRHDIPFDLLTFRDQIDPKELEDMDGPSFEIMLLDHHSLPNEDASLARFVVDVIDHRPWDPSTNCKPESLCLETVASCATLVARRILREHPDILDERLASLLRGPILIDSWNFSEKSGIATPTDVEIIDALEKAGSLSALDRTKVYEEIAAAKTNVEKLTPEDHMIRDLKVVGGVPMVGLPMLVEKFLCLENGLAAIEAFALSRRTSVVVVLGMDLKAENVTRDLAVFSLPEDRLGDKIVGALTSSTNPPLELTLQREIDRTRESLGKLLHYKQGNVRATRKKILPIVRDVVFSECSC